MTEQYLDKTSLYSQAVLLDNSGRDLRSGNASFAEFMLGITSDESHSPKDNDKVKRAIEVNTLASGVSDHFEPELAMEADLAVIMQVSKYNQPRAAHFMIPTDNGIVIQRAGNGHSVTYFDPNTAISQFLMENPRVNEYYIEYRVSRGKQRTPADLQHAKFIDAVVRDNSRRENNHSCATLAEFMCGIAETERGYNDFVSMQSIISNINHNSYIIGQTEDYSDDDITADSLIAVIRKDDNQPFHYMIPLRGGDVLQRPQAYSKAENISASDAINNLIRLDPTVTSMSDVYFEHRKRIQSKT